MICCSSWFRLGFRCLSPFFSLLSSFWNRDVLVPFGSGSGSGACLPFFSRLSFLRKGVLFHHDVLALRGSGSGGGACLPSSLFIPFSGNGVCSIMVLVPPGSGSGSGACLPSAFFLLFSGMISWFFLVPAGVAVLVSPLLSSCFSQERGSDSITMCWFLLVPAGVPVLVSLSSIFFLFFGKGFCSTMMSWFLLVPALGARCLFPFFSLFPFLRNCLLFHHDFLVPGGSGSGTGACLFSAFFLLFSGNDVRGFSWIRLGFRCLSPFFFLLSFLRKWCSWFFLVPARVPVLVSPLFFLLAFLRKGVLIPS